MSGANNPAAFGARGTFVMIAAGFVAFIALLAWLGTGEPQGNNGGAHGLGKGISGFVALSTMLMQDGDQVGYNRVPDHVGGPELLVLTPLPSAEAKDLAKLVEQRRAAIGPTIVITPKWETVPLSSDPRVPPNAWTRLFGAPSAPKGWTTIVGAELPHWQGFLDKLGVTLGNPDSPVAHGWHSSDGVAHGPLPDDHVVLSGGGTDDAGAPLVPLIRSGDGRILAGYFADGGSYPALEAMAGIDRSNDTSETQAERQPLVVVFEPDLLNNRGLADPATAREARRLVLAAAGRGVPRVVFDLSLAGLGAPQNLLSLAFAPPFLAATICLILAMAGVIWRGFARFGPAQVGEPGLPAGKVALVGGGATLLLRARRYHLITGPYVDATRDRLALALGLPRRRPVEETDAAIERIQRTIAPGTTPFGEAAGKLAAATGPQAIALHAAELHTIENALNRKEGS